MAQYNISKGQAKKTGQARYKVGGSSKSSSSSSSLKAPKAPKIKEFKFDSSKLLPQYQTEAANLYAPQLQQLGQLREITKTQAEEAKTRTNADFSRLLEREKESINQRGAFFGGGAIDRENRIGAEQGYALRGIEQQAQMQNLDYDTTQGNIGQAQKDYVAGKVEGAFSSAYQTFRDKVTDSMNKYQMDLGQYNQERQYQFQQQQFERQNMESDRQYALSRAAAGRAGGNAAQGKLDDLLTRAAARQSGGREWAVEVASQYGVDPAQVAKLTARDGWEASYGGRVTIDPKEVKAAQSAVNQSYEAANSLVRLSEMAGMKGAVGAKGISSLFGIKDKPIAGTNAAGYVAQLDQVKSLLTLPEMQHLKGLGAMSDREFATLSSAATSLSLDMSEKDFKHEVGRVRESLSGTLNRAASMGIFNPNFVNVYDLNTGQAGQIPDYEYDPDKYQKR